MTVGKYNIHRIATLFPTLPKKELDELKADIAAHGIQVPILVNKAKDTIIDGRNRILAATELKLSDGQIPIEIFKGEDSEIASTILSRNIRRRHLSKVEQVKLISAVLKAAMGDGEKGDLANMAKSPRPSPSKGERGSKGGGSTKDPHIAAVAAEAKRHAISQRTVERALAPPKSRRPSKPKPVKSLKHRIFVKLERVQSSFPFQKRRYVRALVHYMTAPRGSTIPEPLEKDFDQ